MDSIPRYALRPSVESDDESDARNDETFGSVRDLNNDWEIEHEQQASRMIEAARPSFSGGVFSTDKLDRALHEVSGPSDGAFMGAQYGQRATPDNHPFAKHRSEISMQPVGQNQSTFREVYRPDGIPKDYGMNYSAANSSPASHFFESLDFGRKPSTSSPVSYSSPLQGTLSRQFGTEGTPSNPWESRIFGHEQSLSSSPMHSSAFGEQHSQRHTPVARIPTAKPNSHAKDSAFVTTTTYKGPSSHPQHKPQSVPLRPLPMVMRSAPRQRPAYNNPKHTRLMQAYEIDFLVRNQINALQSVESYVEDYYYQHMVKKGQGSKYILPTPEKRPTITRVLDTGIFANVLGKPVIHSSKTPKTMLQVTQEKKDAKVEESQDSISYLEPAEFRQASQEAPKAPSAAICPLKLRVAIEAAFDSLYTIQDVDSDTQNQMLLQESDRARIADKRAAAVQFIFDRMSLVELQFCVSAPVNEFFVQFYTLPKGKMLVSRSICHLLPQHTAALVATFLKRPGLLNTRSIEESLATDFVIGELTRGISQFNFEHTVKVMEDVLLAATDMDLLSIILAHQVWHEGTYQRKPFLHSFHTNL
eukprot:TRINITY_DN66_c0_g4_i2.p1 TRINITY_DN66_c0_g4~~TRINITY_DN66_c0_g4_i2.p1  ORF type:complete len:587 (-),score=110.38 TRINITY_DN66_c0_g4_i2:841-2601(-)